MLSSGSAAAVGFRGVAGELATIVECVLYIVGKMVVSNSPRGPLQG